MSCIIVIDFWSARIQHEFDELKELHLVCIEKKPTNFWQRLEYFIKCKIGLKESNTQFMQN